MKRLLFSGLCTALVTPFYEGKVNYPMVDVLIRRQIDAGVDAIVLAGTTGESATLSKEEKLELFRRGVKAAGGRCRIIAGTGSNCTQTAAQLSREAAGLGVDGVLVVTPYYNKATQTGLIRHYETVAQAAEVPVIAYNVPSRTGMDIALDTCRELGEIGNIAGIKEASGDISRVGRILAECDLPVYAGNDDQALAVMALGGAGVISVASNVVPGRMNALVSAALAGKMPLAALLQKELLALMELLFCQVNPIPVKSAMEMIGYDCGPCRLPLDGLTEENRRKLQRCLGELGMVSPLG